MSLPSSAGRLWIEASPTLEERHLVRTGYSHQLSSTGSILDNNRRYLDVRQAKLSQARWISGISRGIFENDIYRIPTAHNDRRFLYEFRFALSLACFLNC